MKYLVQVEGERLAGFDCEEDVFKYLDKLAEDMKEREVQEVDEWLNDMKTYYVSNRYCRYPDIILQISEEDITYYPHVLQPIE